MLASRHSPGTLDFYQRLLTASKPNTWHWSRPCAIPVAGNRYQNGPQRRPSVRRGDGHADRNAMTSSRA